MSHTTHPTRTLSDHLSDLTKDDLHRIRRTLDVKNASSLNKSDLVQCLSEKIPNNIDHILKLFDLKRYEVVQQVIDSGGMIRLEGLYTDEFFEPYYYQDHGLLFVDWAARTVHMPKEIAEKLKRIDQVTLRHALRRNSEWVQLTSGLLHYYGTVSIRKMIELVGRYTDKPDYRSYVDIIQDAAHYDQGILISNAGLSIYKVDDPEKVRYEHELRPTIDYYPFTKEEVLRASDDDYIDRTPEYRELVRFMRQQWVMDTEEVEIVVEELLDLYQNGSQLGDLIQYMQDEIEIRDLHQIQQLGDRLARYMNGTRQWFLKGYKPVELSNLAGFVPSSGTSANGGSSKGAEVYSFQTKQKIGRNDPCPCGSGKKFKKCCGAER